jgi:hypothetical protein
MIDSDAESTAIVAAQSIDVAQDDILRNKRVQHFYDPDRLAGKAIAQRLGQRDVIAWDIYMFYSVGSVWRLRPPMPIAWAHQMGDQWPEHYRWEDNLVKELNQIVGRLSSKATASRT